MKVKTMTPLAFTDDSDHWGIFRTKRFARAGHGEFAVVDNLDLTGLKLKDFVVEHLVFKDCVLDGVSFALTDFAFETSFINCSLKNADFRSTHGASVLFYNSDLTGCLFSKHIAWMSVDLDDKIIPSYFINCHMSPELSQLMRKDGGIVADKLSDADQKTQNIIMWRLKEIQNAPILKF